MGYYFWDEGGEEIIKNHVDGKESVKTEET